MTQDNSLSAFLRKIAIAIIALLSIGPLVSSIDHIAHFLPAFPAIVGFRNAGALAHSIWLAAGILGMPAIILLVRRKELSAVLGVLIFVIAYVVGARLVWSHFTVGCWLAFVALVLAGISVFRREA